jgi:Fe-S cluster biogenesis protein NfuA
MLRVCRLLRFVSNMTSRPTPNPDCLQFRPLPPIEGVLPPNAPACDIPYRSLARVHPLAELLFDHYEAEVRAVFLAEEYVAVTKWSDVRWSIELERSICSLIGQFLIAHDAIAPLRSGEVDSVDDSFVVDAAADSEVLQCVKELLRKEVRPMVQRDGGDIRLMRFDEPRGVVMLKMLGACRSCPSSQNTLKEGIERMLQHYVPEVREVVEFKTEHDHALDEVSKQRMMQQKHQEQQQQQSNGAADDDDDSERAGSDGDDSSPEKKSSAQEAPASIAVSFGKQTITATANWNRADMNVAMNAAAADVAEQQERARMQAEIKSALASVGAMPAAAALDPSEQLKSQGRISFPGQQRSGRAALRGQVQAAHGGDATPEGVFAKLTGLTAEDVAAARAREAELEALLQKESAEKQAKMARQRIQQRRRRAREQGFGEPEG